ncbi:MAG: hypothetical protein Hyperionvirus8_35 [Hyperionvirus sp.]|uniref:Uncharacterized protein n=1 Tax=Hyperionvirus sp. TaxID=2487770 RepID=A0A3G5ABA8_9VIRU|nr:MAG: hypothetical protein Hyperionvirus8_35 [Hyperionvirus sp.]
MSFSLYDGKESITQFMRRAKEFELEMNKFKYDKILAFVNDLIPQQKAYTSLLEFSYISRSDHIMNHAHNKKIMAKHSKDLAKVLNIDEFQLVRVTEPNEPEDYIIEMDLIFYLKTILKSIDYSLIWKKTSDDVYYSIRMGSLETNLLR